MATEPKRDSMDASTPDPKTTLKPTDPEPAPAPQHRPLSLTDLPPPIRNKIYAHVLDTELVNLGSPNVSYTHTIQTQHLHFQASRPPFPVTTGLFTVNKAISKEALAFFYAKNLWVKFEVYTAEARHAKTMLEESGVLFSVAGEDSVGRCVEHALEVVLVEKNSAVKRAVVMFPAQYLPRLINFMEQACRASGAWARNHALFLTLRNAYGKEVTSVQGDLLEGFRLLNRMGAVTVEKSGLVRGYAEGLQDSMLAVDFDAESWVGMVGTMLERAEEEKGKGEYEMAVQHCKSAIIAMTYGYLTRAETLHSQPEAFQQSIQRLRYKTELTLGTSLLTSLPTDPSAFPHTAINLLAAETAISYALSLSTNSPSPTSNPWFRSLPPELIPPNDASWFTDTERGVAWFERGKAHLALGEPLFAAGDLERAEQLLVVDGQKGNEGGDVVEEVEKVFQRARESIDWGVKPGSGLRKIVRLARVDG